MSKIQSVNPYTWELNAEYELYSDEIVDEKINKAYFSFLEWKKTSFVERKNLFYKLIEVIEKNIEKYARLQTIEMWMLYHTSIAGLK